MQLSAGAYPMFTSLSLKFLADNDAITVVTLFFSFIAN